MSDLIDRRTAIDALDCINGTEEVLRSLQSAQPETEERTAELVQNVSDSDLISRKAAIDAIQQHRESVLGGYEYDEGVAFVYAAAHNHIIDVIKRLPSAQPEQRWIPCSERLPEDEKEVLVTRHFLSDTQLKKNAITEAFYVEVASRIGDEWTSYSDEYKIKAYLHKVIAWMPLPEQYRERREE